MRAERKIPKYQILAKAGARSIVERGSDRYIKSFKDTGVRISRMLTSFSKENRISATCCWIREISGDGTHFDLSFSHIFKRRLIFASTSRICHFSKLLSFS
jgi:hypothetical protein